VDALCDILLRNATFCSSFKWEQKKGDYRMAKKGTRQVGRDAITGEPEKET
jgi:hypothetical protein